jgi:pyruvate kinase
MSAEPWAQETADLHREIEALTAGVERAASERFAAWAELIERPAFEPSARNLAAYLALRRHDLRPLQRRLMTRGLSSLGRAESRVMPALGAVRAALAAQTGHPRPPCPADDFFAGETRLANETATLFGECAPSPTARLLVTCPSEAATDPDFMLGLARRDVDAIRINCAHDDAEAWARMIGHARAAGAATGQPLRIFMDLAGPKIRTGQARVVGQRKKARPGDLIAVTRPGELSAADAAADFAVECALPEALSAARLGDRIFVDDGKLGAEIEQIEPWGVMVRVAQAQQGGLKLKPGKALNFPDTELTVDALTEQDRDDLRFVAAHADAIEYSFVQTAKDVRLLQAALAELRPDDWRSIGLILKIETARAVAELPELIVQAAARQPTGLMIARGDLSVEIGFARAAEMQEEILWLGEAAAVPVIWATQVLEDLVKTGAASRGEMTDAAMAARADCVMLNKGEHLLDAIDVLQKLLARMEAHQHKKAPMLRRLRSW